MPRSNWVVSISIEDDNPSVYGPYSERRAKQIKESFNRREDKRSDDERAGNFLYASAYPLINPGPRVLTNLYFK